MKSACRDDRPRTAPTGVVSRHSDHRLFHLFESDVLLMSGHVLAFFLGAARWWSEVDGREIKRIVHLKLFIGIQYLAQIVQ